MVHEGLLDHEMSWLELKGLIENFRPLNWFEIAVGPNLRRGDGSVCLISLLECLNILQIFVLFLCVKGQR